MRLLLSCVLLTVADGPAAYAPRAPAPATQPVGNEATPEPATSPGDALERSMRAWFDADEQVYRRVTLIKSPEGYSDAYVQWAFASFRLHRAVREHGVTGRRLREAGWDRDQTLSPGIPEPPKAAEWDQMQEVIRKLEWKTHDDVAEPIDAPWFEGGTQGETAVRRIDGGWTVVLSDPIGRAPAEHLQKFAKAWFTHAANIDAATEKVNDGELRTIREVNDFLEARRGKKRID
jgi:hypothetical protein